MWDRKLILDHPKSMVASRSLVVTWFNTALLQCDCVNASKIMRNFPCFLRIPWGVQQWKGEKKTTQYLKGKTWLFFSSLFMVFARISGFSRKVCWFPFFISSNLFYEFSLNWNLNRQPCAMIHLIWLASALLKLCSILIFSFCCCQHIHLLNIKGACLIGGCTWSDLRSQGPLAFQICMFAWHNQILNVRAMKNLYIEALKPLWSFLDTINLMTWGSQDLLLKCRACAIWQ